MTILFASIIFITRNEIASEWIILVFIIPVIGFWILDGYFLWQERLFRKIYDEKRKQESTNFEMKLMKYADMSKYGWISSIFSSTLIIFYVIEVLFIVGIFFILKYQVSV